MSKTFKNLSGSIITTEHGEEIPPGVTVQLDSDGKIVDLQEVSGKDRRANIKGFLEDLKKIEKEYGVKIPVKVSVTVKEAED